MIFPVILKNSMLKRKFNCSKWNESNIKGNHCNEATNKAKQDMENTIKIRIKWTKRVCITESYISNKNLFLHKTKHFEMAWKKNRMNFRSAKLTNIHTRYTVYHNGRKLTQHRQYVGEFKQWIIKKQVKMKILPKGWNESMRTKLSIFNAEKSHDEQIHNVQINKKLKMKKKFIFFFLPTFFLYLFTMRG